MANIRDVKVTSNEGTLLSGGTGTYDPYGHTVSCSGTWAHSPSVGSHYTIDFSSDDTYNLPFETCNCDSFDESSAYGTFTVLG